MKQFYGFSKKSLETIEDIYLADGAAVTSVLFWSEGVLSPEVNSGYLVAGFSAVALNKQTNK